MYSGLCRFVLNFESVLKFDHIMKQLIQQNRYFFIPYFLYLVGSFILLIVFSKSGLHIFFNQLNTPELDQFFKRLTYLGDGLIYLLIVAILLFYSYRWTLIFVAAVVLSNILVFLGKHSLFPGAYRPTKYFELFENYPLHLVSDIRMHSLHSFPSGHTCTAFTVFLMLALLVRNNAVKFLCAGIAVLTGFSRVYLSQHFYIDVFAGSIIGCGSILAAWLYFERYNQSWLDSSLQLKRNWRQKRELPKVAPES